jgi:hypothetical protein
MAVSTSATPVSGNRASQKPRTTLTRYDLASVLLRYWWVGGILWLLYSAWMVRSITTELVRGR